MSPARVWRSAQATVRTERCDLGEGVSHVPAELTATGNGDQPHARGGGTGTSPALISPTSSDGQACARP